MTSGVENPEQPARRRREPLRGQELMDVATDCVLQKYGPRALARKCRIPFRDAETIHAQLSEEIYRRAESRYTPEGLKRLKHSLVVDLEQTIEDCNEEVRKSRKAEGGINTRAHTRKVAAVRQLSTMLGFNAPVQIAATDPQGHPIVEREMTRLFISDPVASALMLQLEDRRRELIGPTADPLET